MLIRQIGSLLTLRPLGDCEHRQRCEKQIQSVQPSQDKPHHPSKKADVINPTSKSTPVIKAKLYHRGNLSNKSLASIVPPSAIISDSEYLETHLIAVPNQMNKEFPKIYETLSSWVVPRSAQLIASDDEFTLYAVTTFKKSSPEFIHKCREQRWTPRDFKYKESSKEEEQQELEKVAKEEKKLWGEALRLGRISWGEAVMAWVHVLSLRVFVETVLRYGLPLEFVCGLVKVCLPLLVPLCEIG
jgi:hypothetical protein